MLFVVGIELLTISDLGLSVFSFATVVGDTVLCLKGSLVSLTIVNMKLKFLRSPLAHSIILTIRCCLT